LGARTRITGDFQLPRGKPMGQGKKEERKKNSQGRSAQDIGKTDTEKKAG